MGEQAAHHSERDRERDLPHSILGRRIDQKAGELVAHLQPFPLFELKVPHRSMKRPDGSGTCKKGEIVDPRYDRKCEAFPFRKSFVFVSKVEPCALKTCQLAHTSRKRPILPLSTGWHLLRRASLGVV